MKVQSLFSRQNKKNIINLLSAEFARRVVNVTPQLKGSISLKTRHFLSKKVLIN